MDQGKTLGVKRLIFKEFTLAGINACVALAFKKAAFKSIAQSVSVYLAYSWQVVPVPFFIDLVNHCPLASYELIFTELWVM